jgi:hypothetical protein
MTITVTCNICNVTILTANGPLLGQNEANLYQQSCTCAVDGPVQTYDDDGNPLPMSYANVVAVLSD